MVIKDLSFIKFGSHFLWLVLSQIHVTGFTGFPFENLLNATKSSSEISKIKFFNNLPFREEKINDHLKHGQEQELYTILNFQKQIFPSFCQHQKTQSEHEMNCCCFNPLPFTFALLDWTELFEYLKMVCFLHEGLKVL